MIEQPTLNDKSMVYMYGLSDMWTDIFEDSEIVEATLNSSTITLAEVYSYFLQRSSGISLSDIQEKYDTRIKLVLLSEDDLVHTSDMSMFNIDTSIESAKNISNRPLLPTDTLYNEIDFELSDGIIRFSKPITEYRFPQRVDSSGKWQFAIWVTDVVINEKWIDTSFGSIVGFTEDDAISSYKSFLEGIYYLYSNGPNIHFIERGVNLAMGMPYARETEEVLSVIRDVDSGNYHVFTSTQTYEIPFGFNPGISKGHTLIKGEVLTSWVEINDWYSKGDWWYDIYLPKEVLNGITPTQLGKAEPGTSADAMMQTFLKHHMFQVLVTQPNSDPDAFSTAVRLVLHSKPSYTFPIFVWKVPLPDEIINLEYDFKYTLNANLTDTCVSAPSVLYMDRGLENSPFNRGTSWYNRVQGSSYAASLLGYGDWDGNGGWAPEFQELEPKYESYMSTAKRSRGDKLTPASRGVVTRGWRGVNTEHNEPMMWEVDTCSPRRTEPFTFKDNEYTALYMMTHTELINKLSSIAPDIVVTNDLHNCVVTGLNLQELYNTVIMREDIDFIDDSQYNFVYTKGGLYETFSSFANQAYIPRKEELPTSEGILFFAKVNQFTWGAHWVHTEPTMSPTIFPIEDPDWTSVEEVYEYDTLGSTSKYHPKAIMPYYQQTTHDADITHNSMLMILESTSFNSGWTIDDHVISFDTLSGTPRYCIAIPQSTHDIVFEEPVRTPYQGASDIMPNGFGSVSLGDYTEDGYTNGFHDTLPQVTFEAGGTYWFMLNSSYLGYRFISKTGCVIEVANILDDNSFEFVPLNCTIEDARSSFEYPNVLKLLRPYSRGYNNYPNDVLDDFYYLTEEVSDRSELLVSIDGKITFDYSVLGHNLYTNSTGNVEVQYISVDDSLPDDEMYPVGTTSITLNRDSDIIMFIDGVYIPEHTYSRVSTSITLEEGSTGAVHIRYIKMLPKDDHSHMNRSTVERNGAIFLMDRARPDSSYTDRHGYTSYINRSGVYGTEPLRIPRRLR